MARSPPSRAARPAPVSGEIVEVNDGLNDTPPYLEPVFWEAKEGHVIAMDWCEGFMDALHLRERAWEPLLKSEEGLELMFPIFAHLLDENGNFSFATTLPLDGSADGPHTLFVRATDKAGNVSAFAQRTFTLDTTPPPVSSSSPRSTAPTASPSC